jgi:uncharacterized protein (TIGR02391 family)
VNWDPSDVLRLASGIAESLQAWSIPPEDEETHVPPDEAGPDFLAEYDRRVTDSDLVAATRLRFANGHYSDAVVHGVIALNECVRSRSGRSEDGDDLMTIVFSQNGPLLRLNELRSKNDRSEQRGHMCLCQGVVGAWRNPRAHQHIEDEPPRALMMLELLDDLIRTTKAAKRTRKSSRKP